MSLNWPRAALCRRFSHLPWISDAERVSRIQVQAMETVCDACPVMPDCSDYADEQARGGFWAGRFRGGKPVEQVGSRR